MQLLEELKQVASGIERVSRDLFFTMRLLFCEDASDGFQPKGFTTKPVTVFQMKGHSHPHSCGQIRTRFSGFRLKAETNVRIYTA